MATALLFSPPTVKVSGSNTGDVTLAPVGSAPNGNAASLAGQVLNLQPSSAAFPGVMTAAQFTTLSNQSGTNSGDVTLAAVGSTPSANGASLAAQVLTLQPADGTHPGLLSILAQTITGVKTFSSPPSLPAPVANSDAARFLDTFAFQSINTPTADYTFALTDQGVYVRPNKATAINLFINTDAVVNFPIGTCHNFRNTGAGLLTVKATTPGTTTITSKGATSAAPTFAQFAAGSAIKVAANTWDVVGDAA